MAVARVHLIELNQKIRRTLSAYTLYAYIAMVFVELTPFVAFRGEYWTDEEILQELMKDIDSG